MSLPPPLRLAWLRKTEVFTFYFGRLRIGEIRLRTRQLWTPFMAFVGGHPLPVPDLAQFEGVDAVAIAGFPDSGPSQPIAVVGGMIRYSTFADTRHLIAIQGTFARYLETRSRNTRQTLRANVRVFRKVAGGSVPGEHAGLTRFQGESAMREFYSYAIPLSRKTWQGKKGRGLTDLEPVDEILQMAADGLASGYILFCAGRPAAFALCHSQGTTLAVSQIGYDPEFSEWSPGSTLLFLLLESLFAEGGVSFFDLMEGSLWPYKSSFANVRHPSVRYFYFPNRLRWWALVLSHNLLKRLESLATRLLRRAQN